MDKAISNEKPGFRPWRKAGRTLSGSGLKQDILYLIRGDIMKLRTLSVLSAMALTFASFASCDNPASSGGGDPASDKAAGFRAVTAISGVPARVEVAEEISMGAFTAVPGDAANRAIAWLLKTPGAGIAAIPESGVLRPTEKGRFTIRAIIVNGAGPETPFVRDFQIAVGVEPEGVVPSGVYNLEGTTAAEALIDLAAYLGSLPENTPDTAYAVKFGPGVNMGDFWYEMDLAAAKALFPEMRFPNNIVEDGNPLKKLFDAIGAGKYVSVDLSDCVCEYPSVLPNVIPDTGDLCLYPQTRPVTDDGIMGGYLTGITLPDSIKKIGAKFMFYNKNLVSVNFPQALQTIGESAFSNTGITSAVFSGGNPNLTVIGNGAFAYCPSLDFFDFGGSPLEKIGDYAFSNTAIRDITLPEGIEDFGSNVFEGCASLETVNLPPDMTAIPVGAFGYTDRLTTINLDKIKTIGNWAFRYSGIPSADLPALTTLGYEAFRFCGNLRSVTLGKGVTRLLIRTFWECRNLETINLENIREIGNPNREGDGMGVFLNCTSLKSVDLSALTFLDFDIYPPFEGCTSLETVVLGDNLKEISSIVPIFSGCTALRSIRLPKNLEYFDGHFAPGNGALVFSIDPAAPNYGVTPDGKTVIKKGDASVIVKSIATGAVTIPAEIKKIGRGAFEGCPITSVTMTSVEEIGDLAFASCADLETVDFGTNPKTIGVAAFMDCTGLRSIDLGSVTAIGNTAFKGCSIMEPITVPATVTSLGSSMFRDAKIRSIKIEAQVAILPSRFVEGTVADVVDLPASVTQIDANGFGVSDYSEIHSLTDHNCKIGAVIIRALTPPVLKPTNNSEGEVLPSVSSGAIGVIYVPDGSVDAYKASDGGTPAKNNWKKYGEAGKIRPLSEYRVE
jgi:hypothetical protein